MAKRFRFRTPAKTEPEEVSPAWLIQDILRALEYKQHEVDDFCAHLLDIMAFWLVRRCAASPETVERWVEKYLQFRSAGGVTSEQWDRWLRSKNPNKSLPVPARKHLRLVASQKPPVRKLRPQIDGDAA